MSERIDVLAVFRALAKFVNDQTEAHDDGATALLQQAEQADAALTELIEAATKIRGTKQRGGILVSFGDIADLAIALARVAGGQ